jgi:PTH2 family peptidyl-tRNA hydrolase
MSDLRPPPTPVAMIIGTAIVACLSGYMFGIASSLGFFPIPFMPRAPKERGIANYDDEEESEEEEIDAEILDHAPNWANGFEADKRDGLRFVSKKPEDKKKESEKQFGSTTAEKADWENSDEECKMVLVVRTDLGMTKGMLVLYSLLFEIPKSKRLIEISALGKIAAQCSHATLACYKNFLRKDPKSQILRRWERQGQAKVALQVKSEDELDVLEAKALSLGVVAEIIADAGRTQIASGSHTVLGIGPAPKSVIDQITGSLKLL